MTNGPQTPWQRFRAWPPAWQITAAVLAAVLVVGTLYGGGVVLGYFADHVSWMWKDAKDAASDARVKELEQKVADRQAVIDSQAGELKRLGGERDALKAALVEAGADQVKIDDALDAEKERLREVREREPDASTDPGTLLDDLRRAQARPDAHRRRTP